MLRVTSIKLLVNVVAVNDQFTLAEHDKEPNNAHVDDFTVLHLIEG